VELVIIDVETPPSPTATNKLRLSDHVTALHPDPAFTDVDPDHVPVPDEENIAALEVVLYATATKTLPPDTDVPLHTPDHRDEPTKEVAVDHVPPDKTTCVVAVEIYCVAPEFKATYNCRSGA
jgi:hypothetical protein